MKIWTAMKRLNHRYDAWAMHTANKVVDALDHRGEDSKKPRTKKHLSVWDLLPNRRDRTGNEDLMRFIDADWKAWPARNVDDSVVPHLDYASLMRLGRKFKAHATTARARLARLRRAALQREEAQRRDLYSDSRE